MTAGFSEKRVTTRVNRNGEKISFPNKRASSAYTSNLTFYTIWNCRVRTP